MFSLTVNEISFSTTSFPTSLASSMLDACHSYWCDISHYHFYLFCPDISDIKLSKAIWLSLCPLCGSVCSSLPIFGRVISFVVVAELCALYVSANFLEEGFRCLGYTWWCSSVISGSVLRGHSKQCWGYHMLGIKLVHDNVTFCNVLV